MWVKRHGNSSGTQSFAPHARKTDGGHLMKSLPKSAGATVALVALNRKVQPTRTSGPEWLGWS